MRLKLEMTKEEIVLENKRLRQKLRRLQKKLREAKRDLDMPRANYSDLEQQQTPPVKDCSRYFYLGSGG